MSQTHRFTLYDQNLCLSFKTDIIKLIIPVDWLSSLLELSPSQIPEKAEASDLNTIERGKEIMNKIHFHYI